MPNAKPNFDDSFWLNALLQKHLLANLERGQALSKEDESEKEKESNSAT